MVTAPQIALMSGAEISSTTAGTGAGGSVDVTTPGTLMLDGAGVANTQIAASATGPQSGPGGSVTVAANALTIAGGAQIASHHRRARPRRRCRGECGEQCDIVGHRAGRRERDHRLGRGGLDRCGGGSGAGGGRRHSRCPVVRE